MPQRLHMVNNFLMVSNSIPSWYAHFLEQGLDVNTARPR